jgi:hypothetical protein
VLLEERCDDVVKASAVLVRSCVVVDPAHIVRLVRQYIVEPLADVPLEVDVFDVQLADAGVGDRGKELIEKVRPEGKMRE